MKKLFLIITIIIFTLSACTFEEENIFDSSAAERMNTALATYNDLLCSSSNGWVMEYFPTDTTEGYTFLMKFNKSTKVTMAAKNRWLKNIYTLDSCIFKLVGDNGPVLTFPVAGNYIVNGTQIGIFHLFSNPQDPKGSTELDGYGLGGDYEFIVQSANDSSINLIGKKTFAIIKMYRVPENITWMQMFNQFDLIRSQSVGTGNFPLSMVVDKDTFILKNDIFSYGAKASKFRIYPKGGDALIDGVDYAYIFTQNGIRFHTPFKYKDELIDNFVLSADKVSLVSNNKNFNAYIYGTNPMTIVMSNNVRLNFVFSEGISVSMKGIYDKIVANCKSKYNEKFSGLNFKYNAARNAYALTFQSGKYTGIFDFTRIENGNGRITLSYLGSRDKNADAYYNNIPGFDELISNLSQQFKIETYGGMASSYIKFIAVNNPNFYFIVTK